MLTEENIVARIKDAQKGNSYLKGTRVPVWLMVNMLDSGVTEQQILQQYPAISNAEINTAVKYAGSTGGFIGS